MDKSFPAPVQALPFWLEKSRSSFLLQALDGKGEGSIYRSPRPKPKAFQLASHSDDSSSKDSPAPRQRRLTANGIQELMRSIEDAAEAADVDPTIQQVIQYEGPIQLSEGGIAAILQTGIKKPVFKEKPLLIVVEKQEKERRRRITAEFLRDDQGNIQKRRESSELLSVEPKPSNTNPANPPQTVMPAVGLSAETSSQVKGHIAASLTLGRTNVVIRYRGSTWRPEDTAEIEGNLKKLTYIGKEGVTPPRFTVVMSHADLRKEMLIHWERDESGVPQLKIELKHLKSKESD